MPSLLANRSLLDAKLLDDPTVDASLPGAIRGTPGDDVLTGTDGRLWNDGETTVLSTDSSGEEIGNSYLLGFSTDGQKMFFAAGGLYIKDLATGDLTSLSNSGVAVSGDASHFLYSSVYYRNGQAFSQLINVDIATGLTHTVAHVRYGPQAAMSEDGSRVAYAFATGTKHHVHGYSLAVQGSGTIWSGNVGSGVSELQFQHDGALAFLVDGGIGQVNLWREGAGTQNLATNADGQGANGRIESYGLSADRSRLAFASSATNLVDADSGAHADVFVKDLSTGAIDRIMGIGGAEADGDSGGVTMSPNGRLVAFWSDATNLVAGDTDGVRDIFVKDPTTGEIVLLCPSGNVGGMHFTADSFSLAFSTDQSGLSAGDTDPLEDIFLKTLFTGQADNLAGLGGDDLLSGLAGDDTIHGGSGDDTLAGGLGSDKLNGGGGIDTADYAASTASITVDLLHGTEDDIGGHDALAKIENIAGSVYADLIVGDARANLIIGGDGDDTLTGGLANDTLQGGAGDDVLRGGTGADLLDGDEGTDALDYSSSSGVTVDFTAATVTAPSGVDQFINIEVVRLGAGADSVTGSGANEQVTDLGGDNHFDMAGGADVVAITGAGNNAVDLGDGADTLTIAGAGTAVIQAGDGNDHVTLSGALSATIFGGAGVDVLTGGDGDDLIWAADTSLPYSGTDSLYGGGGSDILHGGRYQDGGAGDDDLSSLNATLSGGDGNDIFHGGPTVLGGAGDDYVFWNGGSADGGVDTDTLDLTGWGDGGAGATIDLISGAVTVTSGNGTAHNFEIVKATLFDDAVTAANVSTSLFGQDGADTLSGGGAADHLDGGAGDDVLTGHGGGDVLTGGSGADSFVYAALGDSSNAAPDEIADLEGADVIDLSAIDANAIAAGDQAFIVVASFTHSFGQLVVSYDAVHDRTVIQGDVDGDAVADFTITADGDHQGFGDFVL